MKENRHEAIIRLVGENIIETQAQLCELLKEQGFDVTQATVSRDIKNLALVKTQSENGISRYSLPSLKRELNGKNDSVMLSMLSDSVKSVDHAMNTVVVKCTSGMAQGICAKLDMSDIYNLVGTIAGDDTIFILMRTARDAARLERELHMIIGRT